jgi:hypothetical protein
MAFFGVGGSGGGGSGLPPGGTAGQYLAKSGDADGEAGWVDPPSGTARALTEDEFDDAFQF